jgi:hypothetical protein
MGMQTMVVMRRIRAMFCPGLKTKAALAFRKM